MLSGRRILSAVMLASAFAAVWWFDVNVILIILVCGAVGALDVLLRQKKREAGK